MRRTLALLALVVAASACPPDRNAFVETPEEAIALARGGWRSTDEKRQRVTDVYGEASTSRFEPYTAVKRDGVWLVRGTIPESYRGEALETEVREQDGTVSIRVVRIE